MTIFTSVAAAPEFRESHIAQPHEQWNGYGKATEQQRHPVAVNHFVCALDYFSNIFERKQTFIFNVNKNGIKSMTSWDTAENQLVTTAVRYFINTAQGDWG